MKNEYLPKPGWLAEDIARAGPYRPAEELGKHLGPAFVPSTMTEILDALRAEIAEQKAVINTMVNDIVTIAQCAEAAESADVAEICAAINELSQQRDSARFEASRARGEAHAAQLALKELRKKRNAECRALGRVLMIARDVLEPKEPTP